MLGYDQQVGELTPNLLDLDRFAVPVERVDKPWGYEIVFAATERYVGKVLVIEPGKRPRVTLHSLEPCVMPIGKNLWWTQAADRREWKIEQITPTATGGSTVTVTLQTNRALPAGLPAVGTRACFSELQSGSPYELFLPSQTPWTHRPADTTAAAPSADLEGVALG